MSNIPAWSFIDNYGTFQLKSPESTSSLYFPLVNQAGMMSSITPILHGDIKTGQQSFLTRPLSVEDLHESRAARNFWINIDGIPPWSATGCSALQTAHRYQKEKKKQTILEAGLLWHQITRQHPESEITAVSTSFVPQTSDSVELLRVTITNSGKVPVTFTATFGVPIFGRSADQLRDHRHVTSLLNQIQIHPHGVIVQPTLLFDETGHHPNHISYAVLGAEEDGSPPQDIFPLVEQYRGEGGTLDWPEVVVKGLPSPYKPGQTLNGYEAMGGMRFSSQTLAPGQFRSYIIILGIADQPEYCDKWIRSYSRASLFQDHLDANQAYWNDLLDRIRIKTANPRLDGWTRWVSLQPILRQLFGNSFLPYHDYGRGGRGWRDLWQDILGLLLMQTNDVSEMLESNFAGIRFDGSNATIVGHRPGEFIADRNNIPRVWMDHGAWPLFTTQMYIDWTGNLNLLLDEQPYFKDHLIHRSQQIDRNWSADQGTKLRTKQGKIYEGSIYEHLLIQNLVPFFNVGEHNCIRIEGADWNDALDMAAQKGESVAFTAFYAGNLFTLADLADRLKDSGVQHVNLAAELKILLDSLYNPIVYTKFAAKQERLKSYFNASWEHISGNQITVDLSDLAVDLRKKANWMKTHLQEQEWIDIGDHGWFNGYYDNQGSRIEGVFEDTVQMTLTGQVFQLMFGIATEQQTSAIVESVQRYLYDPAVHGVRLNTKFKYHTDSLGRIFGFAYGHKENGSMFSHMAVMYAYALFQRKLYSQANQLLQDLYQHCQNFSTSRIYPGLPEYLDPEGRGRYPYLTGSASWYILTLITQMFGVRGFNGDLYIRPALNTSWFDEHGQASLHTPFAGRQLRIIFHNPAHIKPEDTAVQSISYKEKAFPTTPLEDGLLIRRQDILELPDQDWQQLDIFLTQSDNG